MSAPLLLSVGEAAQALNIGKRLCEDLIARGDLESVRIGARRLIAPDALTEYVQRLRESA